MSDNMMPYSSGVGIDSFSQEMFFSEIIPNQIYYTYLNVYMDKNLKTTVPHKFPHKLLFEMTTSHFQMWRNLKGNPTQTRSKEPVPTPVQAADILELRISPFYWR